jgi:hypothetical protein
VKRCGVALIGALQGNGHYRAAGGCGDPSIGDLIRKLNEDNEPFQYRSATIGSLIFCSTPAPLWRASHTSEAMAIT